MCPLRAGCLRRFIMGDEITKDQAGRTKAVVVTVMVFAGAIGLGALALAAPLLAAAASAGELTLDKNLPMVASAAALLCVFLLLAVLSGHLLGDRKSTRLNSSHG